MPLSGLERISVRPRGGVARIELVCVRDFEGAEYDPVAECLTSFETAVPPAGWVFREDKAHYSETLTGETQEHLVCHSLVLKLPSGNDTRRAVGNLAAYSNDGFVAMVTMASGERLIAGYSPRFGIGYPLRLVKVDSGSGSVPADFPSVELTLESTDADRSMPLI